MIDIQNIDDTKWFKWFLVRYFYPTDHYPRRITKRDKECAKKIDFKYINFQSKLRDIHKIEKRNSISLSVLGFKKKGKYPVCVSKECFEG